MKSHEDGLKGRYIAHHAFARLSAHSHVRTGQRLSFIRPVGETILISKLLKDDDAVRFTICQVDKWLHNTVGQIKN